MVDYDLKDPEILDALRKIKSLNVKTTIECGFYPWTPDARLVEATSTERRILLTANYNDIHEGVYDPCHHGGIILIKDDRPSPETVSSRLRAFTRSGKRSLAKSHVTHLHANHAMIHTLDEKPVLVPFK